MSGDRKITPATGRAMLKSILMGILVAGWAFQVNAGERRDTTYGATQPDPQTTADRAIWGAIAYSPSTGKDGIFWGAPSRDEAGEIALKHCRSAGRQQAGAVGDCALAIVIFNDWDDRQIGRTARGEDGAPRCGALAVADGRRFAASRGRSLREARAGALAACSSKGVNCRLQQDLCT